MEIEVTADSLARSLEAAFKKGSKRLPLCEIAGSAGISQKRALRLLFKAMLHPTWACVTFEYPPIHGTVVTGCEVRGK